MSVGARSSFSVGLVSLCATAGVLLVCCASALAAGPEAPGAPVVQLPLGATKVTVHGVLNPHVEGHPGTYEFLYEKGGVSCEGGGVAPESPGVMLGYEAEEVSQELTGLEAGVEYTVCLRAETKGGSAVGPGVVFTTAPALEVPEVVKAEPVNATTVRLQGVLNPGAVGEAGSYEFLYNDASPGECQGGGSYSGSAAGAKKEVVPATPIEVGGLTPNSHYTVCLLARNEAGETVLGSPVSFVTPVAAPVIEGKLSFDGVGDNSATVSARVDTENDQSSYHYEYGTDGTYGSQTAVQNLAPSTEPATASAQLTGLEPNTEYDFRLVVTNGNRETVRGEEAGAVFRTLPLGSSFLPDERTYEMVTPVENHNADVHIPTAIGTPVTINGTTTEFPFQVSNEGTAVTYPADPTVGGYGNAGNGSGNQYLAVRAPEGGWTQTNIQPTAHAATIYQGFSGDLASGFLASGREPEPRLVPLAAQAPGEGYSVLYACKLSAGACLTPGESTAAQQNLFMPLFGKPLNRGAGEFGTQGYGPQRGYGIVSAGEVDVEPVFAGVAGSGAGGVLFEANDALISGEGAVEKELEQDVRQEMTAGEDNNYLYDSVGGRLGLVDVLPDGKVAPDATFGARPLGEGELAENDPPDFGGVVSGDGSWVFWTDLASGVVYVRVGGVSTVQVSEGAARYWASAEDGRFVFYTEEKEGGVALYRFNTVTDTREALAGAAADVMGVVGASESGESVYFVAGGVLASGVNGEGAVPKTGEPNLYLLGSKGPVFVATLSQADGSKMQPYLRVLNNGPREYGDWQPGLGQRTAEVAAGGGGVVFMSDQRLSVVGFPKGFPNPGGFEEVYMFEAGADRLFCVSCSSTGEAPPTAEREAAAFLPVSWSDTYLPRWVSSDGDRVFFDSAVPLVSQDTDGSQDVYEWEREGAGSCGAGEGVNGGCEYLLSGGVSPSDSWFVGASENGSDAFIVTRAQLVSQDQNDAFDLYDARVGGVRPTSEAACTGTGCQGVPAPPPTFATPPSGTYEGVGDFPPRASASTKPTVKTKPLTRAQKLARALKLCGRQRQRQKRMSCEAQARQKYSPAHKTKRAGDKRRAK